MKWIASLFAQGIAIMLAAWLTPGVSIHDYLNALLLALVLIFLDFLVKPLLVILTIPISILTLGLFLFVINAIIILLASELVNGFMVSGFWNALLFSIILSLTQSLFTYLERSLSSKNSSKK